MNESHGAHEFSLYFPEASKIVSSLTPGMTFGIDHVNLCHRIARVLRLEQDDVMILFDERIHVRVKIILCDTCRIKVLLLEKLSNKILEPRCSYYVPLLKRDALGQALYSAVELGASEIHLLKTERTQSIWAGEKELSRLQSIMVAAAEQSKQYVIPPLYNPLSFSAIVDSMSVNDPFLFFDPQGEEMFPLLVKLKAQIPKAICLMIGPEADLTVLEKQLLKEKKVQFYRLTATTLRAQQALSVSLGMIRSLLR